MFDGSDDYHHRINDPALGIDENCILVIRGAGPIGWPGSAEVVNMQPPDALIQRGIMWLPTLGDGRQSGTSRQPVDPQRLARKRGGRRARLAAHRRHDPRRPQRRHLRRAGRPGGDRPPPGRRPRAADPASQTPWEELYREKTGQLGEGGVLEFALKYRGTSSKLPRHNH